MHIELLLARFIIEIQISESNNVECIFL